MVRHEIDHPSWCCGARDLKSEEEGAAEAECQTGMKNTNHSKHVQGYQCRDCNFDICLKCVLYYKDLNYKRPKKEPEQPPAENAENPANPENPENANAEGGAAAE